MTSFLIRWYNQLDDHGILISLGRKFSNYTPPYLYLMALATLTSGILSKVAAIKLISIIFDVYAAWIVFRIIRLRYPDGFMPYLAGSIYFSLPTILINSSVWGQADSIYTAFLLTCVYFLLKEMPLKAVLFFALAVAFKQQALFLAPFLLVLTLQKKIPWYFFVLVPVVYIILVAPTVFLGRSWQDVLTIYFSQASGGKALSRNAANLYIFISRELYPLLIKPSLAAGSIAVLAWVGYTWHFTKRMDRKTLLLMALISVGLTPFVLPKMHDRYFYPADALSLIVGFYVPGTWFLPILYQAVSLLSYMPFLLNISGQRYVQTAAIINTLTVGFLLWKQWKMTSDAEKPDP
ncbi:MAG: hypothetical protein IH589_01360 [Anaerolineales bacterium]|nr:hypothetical protein [Anaerolineales bacterium]